MAEPNIGKITQIIGAVLDIQFSRGHLPQINEAIQIDTADGVLTVEVAQHLFGHIPGALENTVKIADRCNVEFNFDEHHCHGKYGRTCTWNGSKSNRCTYFSTCR